MECTATLTVILTIVYGPHAACYGARLFPAETCRICQCSVGQRDGDPGPPGNISDGYIDVDMGRARRYYSKEQSSDTRCSCQRSRRCCEVGGVQRRAPADTRCGAETKSGLGWSKTPDSRLCK